MASIFFVAFLFLDIPITKIPIEKIHKGISTPLLMEWIQSHPPLWFTNSRISVESGTEIIMLTIARIKKIIGTP